MKKLLALTALAAIMFAAPNAYADHHGDGGKMQKHKGGMFQKLDTDGNGEVTKEEFSAFHDKKFSDMDADGNGVVTKDEAEAMRAKWKDKMGERREMKKEHAEEKAAE